jgi:hypothetical protein
MKLKLGVALMEEMTNAQKGHCNKQVKMGG